MQNNKFMITCIAYASAMFLLVCVQTMAGLGWFNALSDEALEIVFSLVPQILIMLLVPLAVTLLLRKKNNEPASVTTICQEINWGKISAKNVGLAFVLGICLYLLNIFVASFFAGILQSFGYQFTTSENTFHGVSGFFISLFLTAVLPGICEEFLHRGLLLNGLLKQYGVYRSVVCVSLLFGLMHMNVAQFFYTTILGWFLCMAVLSSKSLWTGVIIHFTNNALAVYMGYAEELGLPGASVLTSFLVNPIIFILTILIIFVAIGGIMRYMAKQNFEKNLDTYTVKYLASQTRFNVDDFDKVKVALTNAIKAMPTWKATFAYLETFEAPKPTKPLEKTLFVSLFLLGSILTVLTFIWGLW